MQLEDLLPIKEWETLENEIRGRSGLNASVFNVDGIRITDNQKWPNRLCPEVKATPKGQSFICATAHMNIALMAKELQQPVIEECDAGLIKLVVPVIVDNQFIGAVGACGLRLDDGEVDTFLVNKITEIDEDHVAQLSEGIKAITSNDAENLGRFIKKRLDGIVDDYLQKRS